MIPDLVKSPTADFSANVSSGFAPLCVQFTDLSTGSPTDWVWNFGDGNTSALQSPAHTYATPGSFNVSLNVSNSYGSSNVTRARPGAGDTRLSIVNFTANTTMDYVPLCVQFTDLQHRQPDGLELELRRRQHLPAAEPCPHVRDAGQLYGDA